MHEGKKVEIEELETVNINWLKAINMKEKKVKSENEGELFNVLFIKKILLLFASDKE